mmetsp:Transcript_10918/g.67459  ORF Transcript_10918/g.67459 Transcript_10918/m.67459 type:complete len:327 (-) Transcript_10918:77-1057(-)
MSNPNRCRHAAQKAGDRSFPGFLWADGDELSASKIFASKIGSSVCCNDADHRKECCSKPYRYPFLSHNRSQRFPLDGFHRRGQSSHLQPKAGQEATIEEPEDRGGQLAEPGFVRLQQVHGQYSESGDGQCRSASSLEDLCHEDCADAECRGGGRHRTRRRFHALADPFGRDESKVFLGGVVDADGCESSEGPAAGADAAQRHSSRQCPEHHTVGGRSTSRPCRRFLRHDHGPTRASRWTSDVPGTCAKHVRVRPLGCDFEFGHVDRLFPVPCASHVHRTAFPASSCPTGSFHAAFRTREAPMRESLASNVSWRRAPPPMRRDGERE